MDRPQFGESRLWVPFHTAAPDSDDVPPKQLIHALTTISLRIDALATLLGMAASDSHFHLRDGDVEDAALMIKELAAMSLDIAWRADSLLGQSPLKQFYIGEDDDEEEDEDDDSTGEGK